MTNDHKSNAQMMGVWTIVLDPKDDRGIWIRCGTAFRNSDESINVYLDVLPRDGKLHIKNLEPRATEDEDEVQNQP